jgi:hypothetical protein
MVSALHAHLVFVTKYRRGVPGAGIPQRCQWRDADGMPGLRPGGCERSSPAR